MAQTFPLLQCTTKPLKYETFSFGGDDKLGYYHSLLKKDDTLFTRYLDIVRPYSKTEDETEMKELEEKHELLRRETFVTVNSEKKDDVHVEKAMALSDKIFANAKKREQIVEALGGKEFCKTIPIIQPKTFDDYIYFTIDDIPEGHSMAQYEDKAGRKGCLIKLKNKNTGNVELVWVFQRYRETCLKFNSVWLMNGACNLEGVEKIVNFLHQVIPNPPPKYELFK